MSIRVPAGLLFAAGVLVLAPDRAIAAPAASAPMAVLATPVGASPVLPANAVVELEMVDTVSSETSRAGDFFKMRVAVAVVDGERTLVPAGTTAVGQVVHAQKAKGGGKGGELILAARYLELPQGQVRLRSTLGAAVGGTRVRSALALAIAIGPVAMVVKGKAVLMPSGEALSARVAADTPILATPAAGESVPPTPDQQGISTP